MKKKLFSMLLVLCLLYALMPIYTAQADTVINIGDYVQMGKYYDEPILWRCVDIDDNGPLMLADKILTIKPYDAPGDNTSGSHGRTYNSGEYRKIYGSDFWEDSNMRSWLNSTASAGNVTWLCGNPPTNDKVWNGWNDYATEKGFMAEGNFTASERNAIKTVTQKSLLNGYEYSYPTRQSNYHIDNHNIASVVQNYATAYSSQVTDKMFLLDVKQINRVYQNSGTLGTNYWIGKPTQKAVDNSEYKSSSLTTAYYYLNWLRSPNADHHYGNSVRYVHADGYVLFNIARVNDLGARPAFYMNLSSVILKFGNGSVVAPYMLESETVDKTALAETIADATELMNSKTVGLANGNVPQAAKDTFQAAIAAAGTVNEDVNATQAQADEQVAALATATTVFNGAIIVDTAKLTFDISGTAPTIGDIFEVAINLSEISSGTFYSADVAVYYDPTKLQVVKADGTPTTSAALGIVKSISADFNVATATINNTIGLIRYAIYIAPDAANPDTGVLYSQTGYPIGNAVLKMAGVRFKAKAVGDTKLQLAKSGVAPASVSGFDDGAMGYLGSSTELGIINFTKVALTVTNKSNVTGTVSILSGANLTKVSVVAKQAGVLVDTVSISANGSFTISLAPGVYTFEVIRPGYLKKIFTNFTVTAAATQLLSGTPINLLAGDAIVTASNAVDLTDLQATLNAFGKNSNNILFDVLCDLNDDGTINLIDMQALLNNYGKVQ